MLTVKSCLSLNNVVDFRFVILKNIDEEELVLNFEFYTVQIFFYYPHKYFIDFSLLLFLGLFFNFPNFAKYFLWFRGTSGF